MRPSPFVRLGLAAAAAAALATPSVAAPGFHVVLASGTRLVASSRPLVAMGRVSFLDESRRPVTLDAAEVDVAATQAAAGTVKAAAPVWDEKKVQALNTRSRGVQFYGEGANSPATAAGQPATPGDDAQATADKTPAERLRAEIGSINEKIRTMPTATRERSMLVIRQLELQEELSRLLTGPRRG